MNPLPVSLPFTDRSEAGRRLAERVRAFAAADPVVLALPRGGVPVGAELARRLRVPLDVLVVRKVGLPGRAELGVGAIAEDGQVCFDDGALARIGLSRDALAATVREERAELARRLEVYRGSSAVPELSGRDVVVVDDGIATGGTARAALRMVRRQQPARLVLAVPVASHAAVEMLGPEVDHLVALAVPENFRSVGEWYRDFAQLSDGDVTAVLAGLEGPAAESGAERAVRIRVGGTHLDGELAMPAEGRGGVVVGLGRGREDPRQRAIAAMLRRAGHATLLLDLLPPEEADQGREQGEGAVSAGVLSERLAAAVGRLRRSTGAVDGSVGLFASGPAAAAALTVAADRPGEVAAVVLHGGRIDLAEEALPAVRAPVLALVQRNDSVVRELAEWALGRLGTVHELRVVPGAEQLLDGAGAWREAGDAAVEWFGRHV